MDCNEGCDWRFSTRIYQHNTSMSLFIPQPMQQRRLDYMTGSEAPVDAVDEGISRGMELR
jgi:hypothetical protein